MTQFWNDRYAAPEYAYGTEPNLFFKEQLQQLNPGKILLPAEGEGRNAVYAAEKGWDVYAFDSSDQAAKKALKLADAKNVTVRYHVADVREIPFSENSFDCVALLFFHLHPSFRNQVHEKMLRMLKPGGVLILEGFSKKQIDRDSGGPRNVDMLFSKEELEDDFSAASGVEIRESDTNLDEGVFHQGFAYLLQVIAVK